MKGYIGRYGYLIRELTKREIYSRYKGSLLGIFWAILTPLAMLLVFAFVFGEIFQAKWHNSSNTNMIDFSINLFIGLGIFWYFADILSRSANIFVSNPNYIKKVVFPLEILSVVSVLSALFHLLIHFFIVIVVLIIAHGGISYEAVYFPVIIALCIPMSIGITLMLGSIGVYVRDLNSIMGVIINMLMFLSPVFYPVDSIPAKFHWLFYLNPLTFVIEESRRVVYEGKAPNFYHLGIFFLSSVLILIAGYRVFLVKKKGFADVI